MPKLISTGHTVTTSAALLLTCLISSMASHLMAADPSFVGVLALAVDSDVATRLKLDDDTRKKLLELIAKREQTALSLALEIKDLPAAVQEERLAPFVAESEKLGFALMTYEQRDELARIRVAQAGMVTLAEEDVAAALALSDEQRAQVTSLLKERATQTTRGGEIQRRITHQAFERRLAGVLTDKQKATWQAMAGLTDAPASETETPAADATAASEKPADTPAAPGDDKPTAAPADTKAPADTTAPAVAGDDQIAPAKPMDDVPPMPATKPKAPADTAVAETNEKPAADSDEKLLRLSFDRTPWRDVIEMLAEEANLDLHLIDDQVPTGTSSYTSNRTYTADGAISQMNRFLLPKGYTLLRSGDLLTVINLETAAPELLDALAEYVPLKDLDKRGDYDLVRCVFQLVKLAPEDAEEELGELVGPGRGIKILPKSRQLVITDIVANLRTIAEVLKEVDEPSSNRKPVDTFVMQNISANEILQIARPLIGLAEDEMSNDDISLSTDLLGTRIFAQGDGSKLAVLRSLIDELDVAPEDGPEVPEEARPFLDKHAIRVADPQTIFDVLQTSLQGLPDVRMALDPATNNIVLFARQSEHDLVDQTIAKLEGEIKQFEVIPLGRVSAEVAVLMVQQMFGTSVEGEDGTSTTVVDGPKVDADPVSGRLFVRGTPTEIEGVRDIVQKLAETDNSGRGNLRVIPLVGPEAATAIEQAKRFWDGNNPIVDYVPSNATQRSRVQEIDVTPPEKSPQPEPQDETPPAAEEAPPAQPKKPQQPIATGQLPGTSPHQATAGSLFRLASQTQDIKSPSDRSPIRIELTPRGILMQSDDVDALDDFEELLRQIGGPTGAFQPTQIAVFYLRYAKVEEANQLLSQLMGGGSATSSDSLIGDMASSLLGGGGGLLGAFLGGGGSSSADTGTTVTIGTATIVSDPRLNRLIVEGTQEDIDLIRSRLEIIDRASSLTDIETQGKPRLISLTYTTAEEVAKVVREAYGTRVRGGQQQSGRGGGNQNPAEILRALAQGGRGRGGSQQTSQEPQMTLTIDERSNSLIVTAPDQLFEEVAELVREVDQAGAQPNQTYVVRTLENANPALIQKALVSMFGESVSTNSAPTSSGSSSSSSGSSSSGSSFFDQLRAMRAAGSGGFRPSGSGSPFGAGRSGGGSPFGAGRGSGAPSGRGGSGFPGGPRGGGGPPSRGGGGGR